MSDSTEPDEMTVAVLDLVRTVARARELGRREGLEEAAKLVRCALGNITPACLGTAGPAQAQYERSVVSPHLEGIEEAIRALAEKEAKE